MIKTIIFNAPPNSGKDRLGDKLAKITGGSLLRFKDALYAYTADYYNIEISSFVEMASDRDLKDKPLNGRLQSPREMLINVSENIVKPQKGKDYFGRSLAEGLKEGFNIITDSGFDDEVKPVISASDETYIIKMFCKGCTFDGDSRRYLDKSKLNNGKVCFIDFYNIKRPGITEENSVIQSFVKLLNVLQKEGVFHD